jgi:glucose-1-phosphate thymidylyltransferase
MDRARLQPMTIPGPKHMLPLYDKPMIYYPLTALMQVGICGILIISTAQDLRRFRKLLRDNIFYGHGLEQCWRRPARGSRARPYLPAM